MPSKFLAIFMKIMTTLNVLYFDLNELNIDEASEIYKMVRNVLPKEENLLMIPSCCKLIRYNDEKNSEIGGFEFSL